MRSMTDICFKKCVPRFHEADLNTGESTLFLKEPNPQSRKILKPIFKATSFKQNICVLLNTSNWPTLFTCSTRLPDSVFDLAVVRFLRFFFNR